MGLGNKGDLPDPTLNDIEHDKVGMPSSSRETKEPPHLGEMIEYGGFYCDERNGTTNQSRK